MRTVLLLLFLLLTGTTLLAQEHNGLQGAYKRYSRGEKGVHLTWTLKLSGATSGTYTLTKEGGAQPDFSSGYWKKSKLWSRGRDSLDVVILDRENEYEARYLMIQRTGCLTPIDDDGVQEKRVNSYWPVTKKEEL